MKPNVVTLTNFITPYLRCYTREIKYMSWRGDNEVLVGPRKFITIQKISLQPVNVLPCLIFITYGTDK